MLASYEVYYHRGIFCKNSVMGYKLVYVDENGIKLSAIMKSFSAAVVTYAVDRITIPFPDNGPLSVFDNLHSVCAFLDKYDALLHFGNIKLFRCNYVPSSFRHIWYSYEELGYKFTELSKSGNLPLPTLPKGTILADAVMLTKEIKVGSYRL